VKYTMTKKIFACAAVAVLVAAANATAATVSFKQTQEAPSAAAVAAGVPDGARVYKFWVTTDADILSVDRVGIETSNPVFQVAPPFGADNEPPDPAFITLNRALEADTWITTPGATTLLGPGLPGDGSTTTFGDTVDSGAQTNFQFAQITVLPNNNSLRFEGRVNVRGATGPENFAFEFVPEPTTFAMAGLGLIGLAALRRRAA
jgi:hypothetical protein